MLFEINFTENITNVPKEMDIMRDGATVLSICPASKVEKIVTFNSLYIFLLQLFLVSSMSFEHVGEMKSRSIFLND